MASEHSEYVERGAVLAELRDAENHAFGSFYNGLIKAHKIVAKFPAADVRPVVPCRDCQGSSCVSAPTDMLKCVILNRYVTPTEFCAWGHKCDDMREVDDE